MATLWKVRGLNPRKLGKRLWNEIQQDDVFGRAAQLSYYFLLSLFPLLIFLTSLIGVIVGSESSIRRSLFSRLSQVMPPAAFGLIDSTMQEVAAASSGSKISFGILAALWAASNGMGAITEALNVAYDVKESRPWWKQRLTAISLTIGLSVLIIGALVLVLSGGKIADNLAANFALGTVFTFTWRFLQWPIVFATVLFAFAMIYYFAPDVRDQEWVWITPGAVLGVVLWLLVSFGFRLYLHYFDSYSKTYGSLGAVIVLMLWLFFTGAAVLIGGEVNAVIDNEAAEAEAVDVKAKSEKQS
ncbi:MAG: YihY/virulence factor BrkB family protein [Pyrinomonadaceae bacterium]|nr:YihY/virulence factor BrkB family protein [Pyrinomonadaceae bacterium]